MINSTTSPASGPFLSGTGNGNDDPAAAGSFGCVSFRRAAAASSEENRSHIATSDPKDSYLNPTPDTLLSKRTTSRPPITNTIDTYQHPMKEEEVRREDYSNYAEDIKDDMPGVMILDRGEYLTNTQMISSGEFHDVYKSIVRGETFAIKKVIDSQENFYQEINILKKIKHKNIISLIGVLSQDFWGNCSRMFVMNYYPIDLNNMVKNFAPKGLEETVTRKIITDILTGLFHLHNNLKLAHCDLKPQNIVIDGKITKIPDAEALHINKAVIIDLGSAKEGCQPASGSVSQGCFVTSYFYNAMEIIQGEPVDLYKNDIHAVGGLVFFCCTAAPPYSWLGNIDQSQISPSKDNPAKPLTEAKGSNGEGMAHINNDVNPENIMIKRGGHEAIFSTKILDRYLPKDISDNARDFILDSTHLLPENRPDAEKLINHPWFDNSIFKKTP